MSARRFTLGSCQPKNILNDSRWGVLTVVLVLLAAALPLHAQKIATLRPDRAAPGMNVVLEILAKNAPRPFGDDGLSVGPLADQVVLVNPSDSERVVFGVPEVSWQGRLIQIPAFILPKAALGPVRFYIFSPRSTSISDTMVFTIDQVQHLGRIANDVTIGTAGFGTLSESNTLLVDSLIVGSPFQTNVLVRFSLADPDTSIPGNPRLLPVIILSKGPVRLSNATLSLDADSLDGGPGGGGGGHGFEGAGGNGYTGGGSCGDLYLYNTNDGSDSASTINAGGRAATGIEGGESNSDDQGGGGGTGEPFGKSGAAGAPASPSRPGGYGGGSGGGESSNLPLLEDGGGGGGFGTAGEGGAQPGGTGANGGNIAGGRFLIPMAGGSGGGAGNADLTSGRGGSGGGGGGALEIVSFDSIISSKTTFSARGDSGTSGEQLGAGGGGGSGGSIYLASPKGVLSSGQTIDLAGGIGGQGSIVAGVQVGFHGGAGGDGRIRIDGPTNLHPSPIDPPVWANGISLSPESSVPAIGFVHLTGIARDTMNTLDSVRIYYRTRHTAWKYVDTVRAHGGAWSKWLALPHDSLIFVAALSRVASLPTDRYNAEPDWIMSHVSLGVIRHPATPFLVSEDTLNFGTVRVSFCKTLALRITNEGEAPLKIGRGSPLDSAFFKVLTDTPITILPYETDTILVEFCPKDSGFKMVHFGLPSNDVTDSLKTITFIAYAQRRNDLLEINPSNHVIFRRTLLGKCDTALVTLNSIGTDTLYLSHTTWSSPPFSLELIPPDSAIAPKGSSTTRILRIIFCPGDTGSAHQAIILDDRQDTLILDGYGVSRDVTVIDEVDLGEQCFGDSLRFVDTLVNRGNDTITFIEYSMRPIGTRTQNVVLRPRDTLPVALTFRLDSLGTIRDTIFFRLADTTLRTVVTYRVDGVRLQMDSAVNFHFVCVSSSDSLPFSVLNVGGATRFSNIRMANGSFGLVGADTILQAGQSARLRLAFHPTDTLPRADTLRFTATTITGCAVDYRIPISGTGVDSGLAAEPIVFDTVLVGECADDSLFIANPCGATVTIDSIRFGGSQFHVVPSPLVHDTVPSGGALRIDVRFCPTSAGVVRDTVIFYPSSGPAFKAMLSGFGKAKVKPWVHFAISSTTVGVGSTATTTITLDSFSVDAKGAAPFLVRFDPAVLAFQSAFLFNAARVAPDSLRFIATVDTPRVIGWITWQTLLGPHDFSLVDLFPGDAKLDVRTAPGKVTVTDCSNLNGHLSPGGSYAMGPVTPDPAAGEARVSIELGNDGYVDASIYDMTGRLVVPLFRQTMQRGKYEIAVPTDKLSSGRYFIIARSLGWSAAEPFIIGH